MKALFAGLAIALVTGCATDIPPGDAPGAVADLWSGDESAPPLADLAAADLVVPPGPCEEGDATCHRVHYGPPEKPFPLSLDDPGDPLVRDLGLSRDRNGWLRLDYVRAYSGPLWIPNPQDLGGIGTVSRVDHVAVREVARYLSVTCSSLATGGGASCDGENGCCSIDDAGRWAARQANMPEPPHQAVQRTANYPARTAVDWNEHVLIANRAPAGQASVTRIASDPDECLDRNHDGHIDTSGDSDGNGVIDVDCNGDGAPDDIAGVQARACRNGLRQEFYGLDDECVLWTVNVFAPGARATAIGLGGSGGPYSDVWVGSASGQQVRIDGAKMKATADLMLPPECSASGGPWGMTVDYSGVAWVTAKGAGKLCWFDTRNGPFTSGVVRDPQWGSMVGDGLHVDQDQNIWVGGEVARYTPDRSNGLRNLGAGWWTRIEKASGLGITADTRDARSYFVYSCRGESVLQIPASTIQVFKGDRTVADPGWPAVQLPCVAVGIDTDQHLWGVDARLSTRARIDRQGTMTQPTVNGPPVGMNQCPAGDSCANAGAEVHSDFTSFHGIRNIDRGPSSYAVLVPGCTDGSGRPADTEWWSIDWDADIPSNTFVRVSAKAADAGDFRDPSWQDATATSDHSASPFVLGDELTPNYTPGGPKGVHDGWLRVEFTIGTASSRVTPKLKSLDIRYRCPPMP